MQASCLFRFRWIIPLCLAIASIPLKAQNETTVLLATSLNPSKFGQPVMLTATVSPAGAVGLVTFYEGTNVLGVAPVGGGDAQFQTSLLPAGTDSLWAYYGGSAAYAASASPGIRQTVNAAPSTGFAIAPGNPFAAGIFTASLVAGDFNGDGHADVAFISDSIHGRVTVLLGDGKGGLAPTVSSPPSVPSAAVMVAGDFNGDGKTDLALMGASVLTILLGDGSGGFTVGPSMGPASTFAVGAVLAAGDFNGDGKTDLAVGTRGAVSVLLGDGAGGFTPSSGSPYLIAGTAFSLAVGDFNGDGHADIAIAESGLTVLVGDGAGGFATTSVATPAGFAASAGVLVAADWNGDGKSDLAFLNQGGVIVFLGDAKSVLTPAAGGLYAAGSNPRALAAGDFNGDGKLDLVVAGEFSGDVRVLLGDGSGGFAPGMGTPLGVGAFPASLAVADFNSDGRTDLAVLNMGVEPTSGDFLLLLGSTAPLHLSFTMQPVNGVKGAPIPSVAVEVQDANGNLVSAGNPVVILSTGISIDNAVSQTAVNGVAMFPNLVFNSIGLRTLTAAATGVSSATSKPFQITGAPSQLTFNVAPTNTLTGVPLGTVVVQAEDSSDNVVVASDASVTVTSSPAGVSATVTAVNGVARFSGLVFGAAGTYTLTADSPGLTSASSAPFLVAQAPTTTTLTVTPNPSQFGAPVTLSATVSPSANGTVMFYDGVTVLGAGRAQGGIAQISTTMLPAGTRQLHAVYGGETAHLGSVSPFVPQTVKANSGSSFLPARGSPFAVGTYPGPVAAGDFNGDGKDDVAVLNQGGNSVTLLLGDGVGGFAAAPGSPFAIGGAYASAMVAGDFNGDGITDLAIASQSGNGDGGNIIILLGNGSGGFTPGGSFPLAHRPTTSMVTADFNGDGKQDLVVGYDYGFGTTNRVTFIGTIVLLGDGAGGFVQVGDLGMAGFLVVADFNGDGNADLAIVTGSGIAVWLGNGTGGFTAAAAFVPSSFNVSATAAAADFDGDGNIDLAVADYITGAVTVLLGDGAGGFRAASTDTSDAGLYPQSIVAGDFNGDGIPDIALASCGNLCGGTSPSNVVAVLLGDGSGGFRLGYRSSAGVGGEPEALAVGDFNSDGKMDLAITNYASNNLTVLLGTNAGPAARLSLSVSASAQLVGYPIGTVMVEVQDANGAPTSATVTVISNPAGISAVANAVNGVAIFSQLVVTRPGVYVLTASAPGAASVVSNPIAIAAALPGTSTAIPSYGTGSSQTFVFEYYSQAGAGWLSDVRAVVNSALSPVNACYVEYAVATNTLYLFNDAYTGLAGQLVLGAGGTISNGQCSIDGSGSSVSASGNVLLLRLAMTFMPTFIGPKGIWGLAIDQGNLNSGWVQSATWTIPPAVTGVAPTADYATPSSGAGLSQTFTFDYSSAGTAYWLDDVRVVVNSALSPVNACYVQYDRSSNTLYLFNDAYTAVAGQVVAGTGGTASNSQCTISGSGSAASISGNQLTLHLAVAFAGNFAGPKGIWGLAVDSGNLDSGWVKLGTWTPAPTP